MSLFSHVVNLNDAIEDPEKRLENLVRGIFAGNVFDLGSAKVPHWFSLQVYNYSLYTLFAYTVASFSTLAEIWNSLSPFLYPMPSTLLAQHDNNLHSFC